MAEFIAISPDGTQRNKVVLPDNYDMSKVPPGVKLEPVGKVSKPDMGFLESAKEGFMDPYVGLQQTSRHAGAPDAAAYDQYVRAREQNLTQRGVDEFPRFLGSLVNPMTLMTEVGTGGAGALAGPVGRTIAGAIGGLEGAVMRPAAGTDFNIEKGVQAGTGLVTGAGLGALGGLASRTRPPREAVRAAAGNLYDAATASTGEIQRTQVQNLSDLVRNNLTSRPPFFRERFAPQTFAALDELRDMPWLAGGRHPTVADVDQVLQVLTLAERSPDGRERQAAGMAKEMVSDWLRTVPPGAIRSGNVQREADTLLEARRLHRIEKRVESVESAQRDARLRTKSTGAGTNINNATRQEARKLLRGVEGRRWSDEETEELESVVEGSNLNNTLRFIGKYAPSGPVSGITAMSLAMSGHLDAGVALGLAGFAAKKAADVGTQRALQAQAARLLRTSGIPDEAVPAFLRPFIIAPGLSPIAGDIAADVVDALAPKHKDPLR